MDTPQQTEAQTVRPVWTLSRQSLDELEELARQATQDEWKLGHTATTKISEAVRWMEKTIRKRTDPDLWLVFIGDENADDGTLCTAYTGNGPTSRANAEYIAAAQPATILMLVDFLRAAMGDDTKLVVPVPDRLLDRIPVRQED